jgi:hypothetical protein
MTMSVKNMSPRTAHRRYMARMLGAACGYIGTIIAASAVIDKNGPVTAITILVAAVPAICILAMLRAIWKYIQEVDEVARHDHVQAMLAALFVVLAISGSWGLIELFNESLPRLPVFYIFPVFFLIYGLVSSIRYRRCV